ncbi:hypothetical protein SAMN04487988_1201, partial [Algoriphagus hitonicola]
MFSFFVVPDFDELKEFNLYLSNVQYRKLVDQLRFDDFKEVF